MTQDKRPYVGIIFKCCSVYARIYRNAAGTAYEGRCPSCGRPIRIAVAPRGTRQRFFTAHPH